MKVIRTKLVLKTAWRFLILILVFFRDEKQDYVKAKKYFEQCYQHWEQLSSRHPFYVEFKKDFNWAKKTLEDLPV